MDVPNDEIVTYWILPTRDGVNPVDLLAECYSLCLELVQGYIWHHDPFRLQIKYENGSESWSLHGSVRYGECVEDEWMTVAILKHLTKSIDHVAVRVIDGDGEILLIEAADHIPRWASDPAQGEGRAFLYNGQVHLLPICSSPASASPLPWGKPDQHTAARVIANYPDLSKADDKIQQVINKRLQGYPRSVESNHHHVKVILPKVVAAVIHHNPQALSDLIMAVHERDPIDTRKSRAMECVPQKEMTGYKVRFSRCLYAMLSSTKLRPHRSSNWKVDEKSKCENLGYKLSLGLEILLSRHRTQSNSENSSPFDSISSGPGWQRYIERLESVGYFQGELAGSVRYKQLEEQANAFWRESRSSSDNAPEEGEGGYLGDSRFQRIDRIVDIYNKFKEGNESEPGKGYLQPPPSEDDDESWMEITPESLDKMLAARFGAVSKGGEDRLPSDLNRFLNQLSGLEGVDPNQGKPTSQAEADRLLQSINKISDSDNLNFEPLDLIKSMQNLLGGGEEPPDPDGDDSSDDESEAGEDDSQDPVIADYMKRLDREVAQVPGRGSDVADPDQPLQVDASLLSNILQSYSAQLDLNGPASSLLSTLHINPGPKKDEE